MLAQVVYKTEQIARVQRNHRVEIRTGTGELQFFQLKACTREEALAEAEVIASTISAASNKSVLYRLPNSDWTVAGVKNSKNAKVKGNIRQMIKDFFFVEDDEL